MMPVGEPASEKDEAPAKVPLGAAAKGEEDEYRPDAASHTIMTEQEPEIDEFGLPVKRSNRRIAENGKGVGAGAGDSAETEAQKQFTEGELKEKLSNGQDNRNCGLDVKPAEKLAAQLGPPVAIQPTELLPTNSQGPGAKQRPTGETAHDVVEKAPQAAPVIAAGGISEWSHQALAPQRVEAEHEKEEEWQDMPAIAPYDIYDDNGKLLAREARDSDDEANAYSGLGGAGRGYTRVQIDEDAQSATSMDDNTEYLFKNKGTNVIVEDEDQRDPLAQMQATKDMLTEGQRIAYVGVTRLAMAGMVTELEDMEGTKGTKKELRIAVEALKMWSQKMMVRLYAHMEIDSSGNARCSFKAGYYY